MKLSEKAAYLKGLAEGLNIGTETPNDKLISKLLDLVADMAGTIELLEDRCDELTDYADELDADLGDVEEYLFSDDDDDECDCDDDDDCYEVTCPACGEVICFDESCDPEELICPACGEEFDAVCDGECDCCEGCDEE
ncbi:MAG: hypothetical protein IJV96_05525 [Clostridia bacterium]|nr:hypothetical protein [Clostridia bacterium]